MDTHFRGCRCPLRHAKTSSPSLTRVRILLHTVTRQSTRTFICYSRSVDFLILVFFFPHLYSPFPTCHYWFFLFSWSYFLPIFPIFSLSLTSVGLFGSRALTLLVYHVHGHCLSPNPHPPSFLSPSGPVPTRKIVCMPHCIIDGVRHTVYDVTCVQFLVFVIM